MTHKAKGQSVLEAKPKLIGLLFAFIPVAQPDRADPAKVHMSVQVGPGIPNQTTQNRSGNSGSGFRAAQPKPHRSVNLIIRLLAVNHKEIHSDLSQLP